MNYPSLKVRLRAERRGLYKVAISNGVLFHCAD